VKFRIARTTEQVLPEWIEYYGSYTFMLKTTRGKDTLDQLADSIPDWLFKRWQRLSISVMSLCLLLWVVLSAIGVVVGIGAMGGVLYDIATGGIDIWIGEAPVQETSYDVTIAEVFTTVIVAIFSLLLFSILFTVAMSPVLIGLALHEFGHYAGIRRSGADVEFYGLLLSGPLIGGAFVHPTDDIYEKDAETQLAAFAGGITANIIYGSCLLCLSLVLFTDPVNTLSGWTMEIIQQPLPATLFFFGCFEIVAAFANSVPVGGVDGGKFVQVAEQHYGETE
jgi:Zn-dependent protease